MKETFVDSHVADSVTYMFADSSPQAGSDWLLATCQSISGSDLSSCVEAARALCRHSRKRFEKAAEDSEMDAMKETVLQREENGRTLKSKLKIHRLIPMAKGSGASSLERKTLAIARSLYAEIKPRVSQT